MSATQFSDIYNPDEIQWLKKQIAEKDSTIAILRLSEEKFHALYMNMGEGAALHELIYDQNGEPEDYVIIETNPAFGLQLGISREAVIGKTSREAYGVTEPPYFEIYTGVALTGEPFVFETYFPPLAKYFSISVYCPYKGSFATIFEDITARKQDEIAVTQTNDALTFLAQYTGTDKEDDFFNLLAKYLAKALEADFVCIDSLEGDGLNARTVSVWCDGKFEDNTTYALKDTPCGEVVGKTVCCFPASVCQFFPRDAVLQDLRAESYVGATLWSHSGKAIGLIAVIKRKQLNNHRHAEELLKIVSVRAAGEMERIKAEEALKDSEELYRSILNASPDAITITNMDGCILMVSPGAVSMFGCDRSEQLIGLLITDFIVPDDREFALANIRMITQGIFIGAKEYRGQRRDGSLFDFEINSECIRSVDGLPTQMVTIIRDISMRKKSDQVIKLKNEQLLKLNAEKDKFFSILAHDLRSPFNGFLGLTHIMAQELSSLTMTEIQEIAMSMKNSATSLFSLLENLLQWAGIQQGTLPVNPKFFKLLPLANESIAVLIEPAKNKKIEIVNNIAENLTVYADSNILQSVFRNLISNAVKFTQKGGIISLAAKENSDRLIEISVQDSGIGMSSSQLNNLFRLDGQTGKKGTDGEPSTGLGLLLCKEFIEKHGGQIWVKSEVGKGSVFYFTIPCKGDMTGNKGIF